MRDRSTVLFWNLRPWTEGSAPTFVQTWDISRLMSGPATHKHTTGTHLGQPRTSVRIVANFWFGVAWTVCQRPFHNTVTDILSIQLAAIA